MSDVVQHNKDRYVALPAAMHPHDFDNLPEAHCDGWNACLDEIAKLGPLYTHADPGEVERLRASLEVATHNVNEMQDQFEACKAENDTLRAQLAERGAQLQLAKKLLRQTLASLNPRNRLATSIRGFLKTASAEASTPECDERAKFEGAVLESEPSSDMDRNADGGYMNFYLECAWKGWQARAALERKS